jgi:membrane protein involved in colicin uptake
MPGIPSLFAPFLEEGTSSEEKLKHLEKERKHTYETVKMMKERLKRIDKGIREIKKQAQNDAPQHHHRNKRNCYLATASNSSQGS